MHIFFPKSLNFFASDCPPAPFFMAKVTRTKQLIDCGLIKWVQKFLNISLKLRSCSLRDPIGSGNPNCLTNFKSKTNQIKKIYLDLINS